MYSVGGYLCKFQARSGDFTIIRNILNFWFGTVYAFHKPLHGLLSVNCPITCSKIICW
jgi:hypothetical protein